MVSKKTQLWIAVVSVILALIVATVAFLAVFVRNRRSSEPNEEGFTDGDVTLQSMRSTAMRWLDGVRRGVPRATAGA